jgi:hypothetical protein
MLLCRSGLQLQQLWWRLARRPPGSVPPTGLAWLLTDVLKMLKRPLSCGIKRTAKAFSMRSTAIE